MKKNQFTIVAFAFCLWLLAVPLTVWATDGQIKIGPPAAGASFPIVINQAGSYVLTDNLVVIDANVDAIQIEHNDVTLDLNGHTIHGPANGGTGSGIWEENRYSITILNGRVWGFGSNGISLSSTLNDPSLKSAGHILKDIQAFNNSGTGITIYGGTVSSCIANGNGEDGIFAFHSSLNHCTTNKNARYGLYLSHSTGFNCTANGNSSAGITASSSTIDNMTAHDNNGIGIDIFSSSVTNCAADGNTGNGFYVSDDSRVENNHVSFNQGYGIQIYGTSNYVIKNTGVSNNLGGISSDYPKNYVPLPADGDNANRFF